MISNRLAGFLSICAALIAISITIPFSAAYFLAYGDGDPVMARPWFVSLGQTFPNWFDFARPAQVYQIYGRIYSLVIPLTLLALLAFKKQLGVSSRPARWGWRILWSGALLGGLGIIGDYWPDPNSYLVGAGFMLEMIGILILWAGALFYGFVVLGMQRRLRSIGLSLICVPLVGILGLALFAHLPSGPLLGYGIFSLLIGWYFLGRTNGKGCL